jgi:hypothetical protein
MIELNFNFFTIFLLSRSKSWHLGPRTPRNRQTEASNGIRFEKSRFKTLLFIIAFIIFLRKSYRTVYGSLHDEVVAKVPTHEQTPWKKTTKAINFAAFVDRTIAL